MLNDTHLAYLCWLIAAALVIVLLRTFYRSYQQRFVPRIRIMYESTQGRAEYDAGVWYCPQCYTTTGKPGCCPNDEHVSPVRVLQGRYADLQEYERMRKLLGTPAVDE